MMHSYRHSETLSHNFLPPPLKNISCYFILWGAGALGLYASPPEKCCQGVFQRRPPPAECLSSERLCYRKNNTFHRSAREHNNCCGRCPTCFLFRSPLPLQRAPLVVSPWLPDTDMEIEIATQDGPPADYGS